MKDYTFRLIRCTTVIAALGCAFTLYTNAFYTPIEQCDPQYTTQLHMAVR